MTLLVVAAVEELRTESPLLMLQKTMGRKLVGFQASSQSNQLIVRNQTPNTESKNKHRRQLWNLFVFCFSQNMKKIFFQESEETAHLLCWLPLSGIECAFNQDGNLNFKKTKKTRMEIQHSFFFLFISLIVFFDTIHEFSVLFQLTFYFYLQFFQQKVFCFNKINGF